MIKRSFFISILLFSGLVFRPFSAVAEIPEPSPVSTAAPATPTGTPVNPSVSPSPTPSSKALTLQDLYELETLLAENTFKIRKTIESRAELVVALEKYLAHMCMKELPITLKYVGHAPNPKCGELIDTTLAVDSANPVALCARDGIDSTTCRGAYAEIAFATYNPSHATGTGQSALDATLAASKNEPIIEKLEAKVMSLTYRRTEKLSPEKDAQLRTLYAQLLSLTCKNTGLKLVEAKAPTTIASGGPNLLADDSALFSPPPKTTREPFGAPPTTNDGAKPAPQYFARTRLIPDRCNRFVEESLANYPDFAPALCAKWSYYSPNCIDSKRRAKRRKEIEDRKAGRDTNAIDSEIGTF